MLQMVHAKHVIHPARTVNILLHTAQAAQQARYLILCNLIASHIVKTSHAHKVISLTIGLYHVRHALLTVTLALINIHVSHVVIQLCSFTTNLQEHLIALTHVQMANTQSMIAILILSIASNALMVVQVVGPTMEITSTISMVMAVIIPQLDYLSITTTTHLTLMIMNSAINASQASLSLTRLVFNIALLELTCIVGVIAIPTASNALKVVYPAALMRHVTNVITGQDITRSKLLSQFRINQT